LNLNDPFISENGGAVFIPKNYFRFVDFNKQTNKYDIIELGVPYSELRKKFQNIRRKTGCKLVGFGDMTVEELSNNSGLSVELAEWAKRREYGEPFIVVNCKENQLYEAVKAEELYLTKGDRYYHLKGKNDKGKAVVRLTEAYIKNFGQIRTIGVGNSPNDLPMLDVVDLPFFREKNEPVDAPWKKILNKVVDKKV
jgi:mannosyl-3-phosphoglycerate phosphatase